MRRYYLHTRHNSCLTYHGIETEEKKKAKIMDMSSYVKALVDVDMEIADGTSELWDFLEVKGE